MTDSIKTELEGLTGTDAKHISQTAMLGMKISNDSVDYYYFMSFLASAKMWMDDDHSKDSLLEKINAYIHKVKLSKPVNDIVARCYIIEGNKAILNHESQSSIDFFQKALKYQQRGSRMLNQAIILTTLADGYFGVSDYANGASCLRRALFLSDSLKNTDAKIQAICGLAKTYVGLRNFKEAEKYLVSGKKLIPFMHGRQKFFFYTTLGNYYYYQEDYQNTLKVFVMINSLLDTLATTEFDRCLTWINLADAYVKVGNIDSARVYQRKCRPFFVKNKNEAALYYLETQDIAILLKQGHLALVKRILDKKVNYQNIESDQTMIRAKYLLDYYMRIGDDHHALLLLHQITHDNDSIRNEVQKLATAETAFRYEQDSKALKLELNLSQSMAHLRTYELFLTILIFIIVLLVVLFYVVSSYNQRRREKLLNIEKERVMKLRMEELRNRVSPHFIFNVLNYEIYNWQHGKETTDIPKLVKLLRSGLEESDRLCVSLSKELDFVDGYVELQGKGLGDNFVYNMNIAEDVDIDDVQIPSMMIQTAVENAIKHGLRGLEREKVLEIRIDRQDCATHVAVTDNGRGMNAADDSSKGTGTGMRVIRETLEMLNSRNENPIIYGIKENPHGRGCRVDIIFPDAYNYSLG